MELPPQREMEQRIMRAVLDCTPQEWAEGYNWYPNTYEWCQTLALGTTLLPEQVAGVVSALSPRCNWDTNKAWARRCVEEWLRGATQPPPVNNTLNRGKAWAILGGGEPTRILGPMKTGHFYRAIVGDEDAVPVDSWAYALATGERLPHNKGVSRSAYGVIVESYNGAAQRLGLTPRRTQSLGWGRIRKGYQ